MIKINEIYIETKENKSSCHCKIDIKNETKDIIFEVDTKYEKYLVTDRADAYLIGLLHFAMINGYDIECKLPVTDELLYNIKEVLVPMLYKYDKKNMHKIKISADVIKPIEQGEHIGTGLSCGVDSFYSIYKHFNDEYPSLKLTDLCINNVGAFNECYKNYGINKIKEDRYKITEKVAKEIGINLIKTDSNFWNEIYQNHLLTHTYSSVFAVYMLQKYWKKYYYASSGYDFGVFDLKDNGIKDSAYYELLSLQCFSTSAIRIYSDGGEKERIEKTKEIIEYNIAQKYLHVCLNDSKNCGKCSKCRRTLLMLDALNALEKFKEVFDIEEYENNKNEYYKWLWKQHYMKDEMNEPTYIQLCERKEFKVSFIYKIRVIIIQKMKETIKKTKLYERYKENKFEK